MDKITDIAQEQSSIQNAQHYGNTTDSLRPTPLKPSLAQNVWQAARQVVFFEKGDNHPISGLEIRQYFQQNLLPIQKTEREIVNLLGLYLDSARILGAHNSQQPYSIIGGPRPITFNPQCAQQIWKNAKRVVFVSRNGSTYSLGDLEIRQYFGQYVLPIYDEKQGIVSLLVLGVKKAWLLGAEKSGRLEALE